jgi:hypothetical protein
MKRVIFELRLFKDNSPSNTKQGYYDIIVAKEILNNAFYFNVIENTANKNMSNDSLNIRKV